MVTPTIPMRNLGSNYAYYAGLTWLSTTSIAIGIGQMRDVTNTNDIVNPSILTVVTTTNGANALDTGTIAASTFYAVYLVGDSTGYKPTCGLLSANLVTPSAIPFEYDMFRRIGFVLTDGSAHILAFYQTCISNDRYMWYDVLIPIITAGTSATYATVSTFAANPLSGNNIILQGTVTPTAAGNTVNFRPTGSSSTNGLAIASGSVAAVAQEFQMIVPTSEVSTTLGEIDYKVTGSTTVNIAGYVDSI